MHEQFSFGPSPELWAEGEKKISKMVFIGKNLDQEALQTGFEALRMPEAALVKETCSLT